MWDLSKKIVGERMNAFDTLGHFKEVIEGTKVTLTPFSEIFYPEGWKELIEDFVTSISEINSTINKITQGYGFLDITFSTKQLSNEARIWRAISDCRKNSYLVCHVCGSSVSNRNSKGCYQLCSDCHNSAGTKGLTGTWLDRY